VKNLEVENKVDFSVIGRPAICKVCKVKTTIKTLTARVYLYTKNGKLIGAFAPTGTSPKEIVEKAVQTAKSFAKGNIALAGALRWLSKAVIDHVIYYNNHEEHLGHQLSPF